MEENLSLFLYPDLRLYLEPAPHKIRELKDDEVLLKVSFCGICGSDLHLQDHGSLGDLQVSEKLIIGHEASGVVVKTGRNVKSLKKGDRVAIENSIPCSKCELCLEGKYHLCPSLGRNGLPGTDGFFTRYLVHPAQFCFKLPDNVTDEQGALVEPLSVGLWACIRGGVKPGDIVLILGAGPIGIMTMLNAKAMGASTVIMTDLNQPRLELAKSLGADEVILVSSKDSPESIAQRFSGRRPNVSLDCAGFQNTLRTAIFATKPGGTAVIVGLGQSDVTIPLIDTAFNEVDIRGVNRYPNCYPRMVRMLGAGQIQTDGLVTHVFPLKDVAEAFHKVRSAGSIASPVCKVLVRCE